MWRNATVNILSALAVCDYACRWLFLPAPAELGVESACFPGQPRAGTAMSCRSSGPGCIAWFLSPQHFVGFAFCALGLRGPGGGDSRAQTQRLRAANPAARASATRAPLQVVSSSPFALREVSGSVFKLNSHVRVTTTIFISSR